MSDRGRTCKQQWLPSEQPAISDAKRYDGGSGYTTFVTTVGSVTYTGTYTTLNSSFDELRCTGPRECRGYAIKIADNVIVFWWTDINDPLKAVSLPTMAIVQGVCLIQGANYNLVRLPSNTQKQSGWYPTDNGSGRDDVDGRWQQHCLQLAVRHVCANL